MSKRQASYARLAPIYDRLMEHVDYPSWAAYLRQIASRYGNGGKRIADLGCGTGSILALLKDSGYRGIGIDLSSEMLAVARGKGVSPVAVGDMRRISLRGPFDLITCSYDSVNHLTLADDVQRFLDGFPRLLAPGGVAVFDVVTEMNVRRHFHRKVFRERAGDVAILWRSRYVPSRRLCQSRIAVSIGQGKDRSRFCETHTERIYPPGVLTRFLKSVPLERLGPFNGFGFNPATEASERVHYVLRKSEGVSE